MRQFVGVVLLALATQVQALTFEQVFRREQWSRGDVNVEANRPIDAAAWIGCPQETKFCRFRCEFRSDGSPLVFDVSADERFVLFVDGREVARGPDRGVVEHWYYSSHRVDGLERGPHAVEAVVWALGDDAPNAQVSWRQGFVLKAEGAYDGQLTTGKGRWQVAPLHGTSPRGKAKGVFGVGSQFAVTGCGVLSELPPADAWQAPRIVRAAIPTNQFQWGGRSAGWMLFPTPLPNQVGACVTPGRVVNSNHDLTRPFEVAPKTRLELVWDLGDYFCAYPQMTVSEGAGTRITWGWAESLRDNEGRKGDRNEWKGKRFVDPVEDVFMPDGRDRAEFTTPWWRCGRWCRLVIQTGDAPLMVQGVSLRETHYPLAVEASFASDDPLMDDIGAICRRTVRSCCHQILFDCPYYEQQMYPGDMRIQLDILASLTWDARMGRSALAIFDFGRCDDGRVAMNFPSRGLQESWTYTLCWIMAFRDHLLWHGDLGFMKSRLAGIGHSLGGIAAYENGDGLLENLPGWNFVDWVPEWNGRWSGVAPCGGTGEGVSSVNNLLYVLALQSAAAVAEALGDRTLAAAWRGKAERLGQTVVEKFWDDRRGMLADTLAKDRFSEHAQCLSILGNVLGPLRRQKAFAALTDGKGIARASTYFAFYLFETYRTCGRSDLIRARLADWKRFLDLGGKTAFETQSAEARSDCHAWSACPLYFYQTAFAGVTPDAPCFRKVRIAPQPAGLKSVRARTPSPSGVIETDFRFDGDSVRGQVVLPQGLTGEFAWRNGVYALASGTNEIDCVSCATNYAAAAVGGLIESGELPGAVSVLYDNGRLEASTLGWADRENKVPMSMDTMFMVCSQTKSFCGVTVAMLMEEGKLSLEDPVSKYLPEFKELWVETENTNGVRKLARAKNVLTLRHVLTHTGGFPFQTRPSAFLGWTASPLRVSAATASASPLLFEPGTRSAYSNTGIDIAAAIVEVVTHERWEAFLQRRIFDPLEMHDTTFFPAREQVSRLATLYEVHPGTRCKALRGGYGPMPRPYAGEGRYASAGAGLFMSVNDMVKFYRMLAGGGVGMNGVRILKDETVRDILARKQTPECVKEKYSLGIACPDDWFGHGGALMSSCMVDCKRNRLRLWAVQLMGAWGFGRDKWNAAGDSFFASGADHAGADKYTGRVTE